MHRGGERAGTAATAHCLGLAEIFYVVVQKYGLTDRRLIAGTWPCCVIGLWHV